MKKYPQEKFNSVNQYMNELEETIEILELEISRLKIWRNENFFHNGTAIGHMNMEYRTRLKKEVARLREELKDRDETRNLIDSISEK
ncbi:hypothetical protein WCWAEYFT_CDS0261 [Vibrio phage VB_VaC_TDDLMA]